MIIEVGASLAARLELLGEAFSIQRQAAVLAPVQVVDERLVKGRGRGVGVAGRGLRGKEGSRARASSSLMSSQTVA